MTSDSTQQTLSGGNFEEWEFAREDTRNYTHGLHPYPARMIPQISKKLIMRYSTKKDIVLDPFAGSGGVLVESKLQGRSSIGFDINPLACLLQKVKTTPIEQELLQEEFSNIVGGFKRGLTDTTQEEIRAKIPPVHNISHWFKPYVVEQLAKILNHINKIEKQEVRDFFKICFSSTIFKASNIAHDDNPYFIRAKSGEKLKKHKPDVFAVFVEETDRNIKKMKDFTAKCKEENVMDMLSKSFLGDAREIDKYIDSVDLVVTSPPYGEERNTMSYTRFSKLSNQWLGYDINQIREYEKLSLGYKLKAYDELVILPSEELQKLLPLLHEKRAKVVGSFFSDYMQVLEKLSRVITPGGFCCVVIGNRTASGNVVFNDKITIELAENFGFSHIITHYRNIPKKVLPRHDGKVSLINRESIIILRLEKK